MGAVGNFLIGRWFLTFLGTALIAVLIWFFGPLLGFLEPVLPRAIIVAVLLLLWLVVNLLISRSRRKADSALVKGAAASGGGPSASEVAQAEETAAMGEKLSQALAMLQKARGTRGYLYEQPWYIIIGPPGAGKTTALLNAGLQFPLAAEMGQGAVAGVGGTRMCDWWFTENAVLIDTAGRYTTQDSDAAVDRAGWESFLDLLKRTRVRQPLNGVIVAISVADVAQASAPERSAHARAIRRRIKEITERLAMRVPVYALFTKADLIAGFTEYFDDLDRERRGQVWGATFPPATGEAGPVPQFAAEFRALVERVDARLFDRLQAERSPERRAMIAGFPAQVASLEQPLGSFLQEAFGGSRLDPAPFLRGVYLASGTQEGTPIDRLTGVLSRSFGLDQRRAPSLRPEQGRSYFLTRLLRDVIFNEAMLVSTKPGAARRQFLLRAGAFAAIALVTLGVGAALWRSEANAQAEVDTTAAALAAYEKTASPLKLDPVSDDDLPRIAPLLDQARGLPHGYELGRDEGTSWVPGIGLSQNDKLAVGSKGVYRHALERVMLPRLVWRLEAQMRGNLNRPDFLYEATRVYLMLGNAGPLDKGLVAEWMTLDWQQAYPGPGNVPLRESLGRHLDAMLAEPLPDVALDGPLVEDARRAFSRVPLAQRVYSRIRPVAAAQQIAPWTPGAAAGASGVRLFVRSSGKPLTDGIPGLYTVDGFHKAVLPAIPQAAREVAGESWVLGTKQEISEFGPQMNTLQTDVVKLYTDEYARAWDDMLADLNVMPQRSLNDAVQQLYLMSSPQSPMRDLLTSVTRQLTLSVPPPPAGGAKGLADAAAGAAAGAAQGAGSRLAGVMGVQSGPPPEPPGKAIDDRYKALRDFVGSGPGAPIDNVLKLMNDLQQQLGKIAAAPPGSGAAPAVAAGDDPAKLLTAEASRAPQPVARWIQAMAVGGGALRSTSAKAAAAAALAGAGGPASLCQQAVEGRYPFSPGAKNEIPMDDFAKLFAPSGQLDEFFNAQLRPFVDMSGRTWKPQDVGGVAAPVGPGDLAQFQRAAAIRDLFFGAGGNTPTVRFDIMPGDLDTTTKQATLELGSVTITSSHGPARPTQVTWPGADRMNTVRLAFDPPPAGGNGQLQQTGPWALFRLFSQGTLSQGGSAEQYVLTFKSGDRMASFQIRAASVLNPFAPGMLQDFRCPTLR